MVSIGFHSSHSIQILLFSGYPAGPYTFPTDGKQPVILGPNGTPVYPNLLQNGDKEYEEEDPGKKAPPPAAVHAPSPTYDFHDDPKKYPFEYNGAHNV